MKKKGVLFIIVLFFLLSIHQVLAFGVAVPYWDDEPLEVYPGQVAIINLSLQNVVGSSNFTVKAQLTLNAHGMASLVYSNKEYFVALGSEDVSVPIKIFVPKDSLVGSKEYVEVKFIPLQSGQSVDGGMVDVAKGFNARFPVIIIKEPENVVTSRINEKSNVISYILLSLLLVVLLVLFRLYFLRRKKKKDKY